MNRAKAWLLPALGAMLAALVIAWFAALGDEPDPVPGAPAQGVAAAPTEGPLLEGWAHVARPEPPSARDPAAPRARATASSSMWTAVGTISTVPTEVGRLGGTVYDADGGVVAGARLTLYRQPTDDEAQGRGATRGIFMGWQPLGEPVQTSASGVFVVEGVPDGIDLLVEVLPPWGLAWSARQRRTDALLRITLPRSFVLKGRVLDVVTRAPLANARVNVQRLSANEWEGREQRPNAAGEFAFHVPREGDYAVGALAYALRSDSLGLDRELAPTGLDVLANTVVAAGSTNIELRLWRGYEITGVVGGSGGVSHPDAIAIQIYARTKAGEPDQRRRADASVLPDGSFRIDLLPAGAYDLLFLPPGGHTSGPSPAALTWMRGIAAPTEGLRVSLAEGAVLRGRLVDAEGQPVLDRRGFVYVREQEATSGSVGSIIATLDGEGGFTTPALRADRDHVLLVGGFAGFAHTEISAGRPGAESIVVRLHAARSIRGVVHDGDGRAVARSVPVSAWIKGGPTMDQGSAGVGHTDDTGRFVIEGLTAERYEVAAGGGGSRYAPSAVLHDVPSGSDDLDLQVKVGSSISGRLVDPRGAGVQVLTLVAAGLDAPALCASRTRVDDRDGTFLIAGLPRGRARLSLDHGGRSVDLGEVEVPADRLRVIVPDPDGAR